MGEMFLDYCTYDVAAQDFHTGVFQFQQQMHIEIAVRKYNYYIVRTLLLLLLLKLYCVP